MPDQLIYRITPSRNVMRAMVRLGGDRGAYRIHLAGETTTIYREGDPKPVTDPATRARVLAALTDLTANT